MSPDSDAAARLRQRGYAVSDPPRTWVLEMPAGMELLNSNQRHSWRHRARVTRDLREAACWLARIHKVPRLEHASILAVYEPPDRRKRDPANWHPSVKAIVDGLVADAGVLPDDDSTHLRGPLIEIGEPYPRGRLVLHITEVARGD